MPPQRNAGIRCSDRRGMNEQEARARHVYEGNVLRDLRELIATFEQAEPIQVSENGLALYGFTEDARLAFIETLKDAEAVILNEYGDTAPSDEEDD
jgi:hypothetical protein